MWHPAQGDPQVILSDLDVIEVKSAAGSIKVQNTKVVHSKIETSPRHAVCVTLQHDVLPLQPVGVDIRVAQV